MNLRQSATLKHTLTVSFGTTIFAIIVAYVVGQGAQITFATVTAMLLGNAIVGATVSRVHGHYAKTGFVGGLMATGASAIMYALLFGGMNAPLIMILFAGGFVFTIVSKYVHTKKAMEKII